LSLIPLPIAGGSAGDRRCTAGSLKMPGKADEHVAEALRVAMFDFLVAVKQGAVSLAQRSALERALANAKELPDGLYCAAISKARIDAAYRT
jgi:hypothetical protein